MANASPRYTAELKARAVELYKAAGPDAAYAEIARELGCDAGSPSHWAKTAGGGQPDEADMNPFQMREENRRLKREPARLKEESGILIEASASFASKQLRRRRSSHS